MIPKENLEKKLLSELQEIISITGSLQKETQAIKTENYLLYSVADPHKYSVKQCLKDFFLKNKLRPEGHQVLEVKLPLAYEEYLQRRDEFLLELNSGYDYEIKKPRKRDQILSHLKGKTIKEIVYSKMINVAFYESKTKRNNLEFIYEGSLKSGVNRISDSLIKLHRNLMRRHRGNKYLDNLKQRIVDELEEINFKSYQITDYLIKISSRDVAIEWGMLEIRPLLMTAYIPSKKYIDSLSGELYYNRLLKAYEGLIKVLDKEHFDFLYTFEEIEKYTGFTEAIKYFNAVTGRT